MVIETDLIDEILTVAREKTGKEGLSNIGFHRIDAEKLICTDSSFDAETLRWGLMFMPQPQNCLAYWEAISDLAAPVMALVGESGDSVRSNYIGEVIRVADTMKQDGTLRMKGTTWIASTSK